MNWLASWVDWCLFLTDGQARGPLNLILKALRGGFVSKLLWKLVAKVVLILLFNAKGDLLWVSGLAKLGRTLAIDCVSQRRWVLVFDSLPLRCPWGIVHVCIGFRVWHSVRDSRFCGRPIFTVGLNELACLAASHLFLICKVLLQHRIWIGLWLLRLSEILLGDFLTLELAVDFSFDLHDLVSRLSWSEAIVWIHFLDSSTVALWGVLADLCKSWRLSIFRKLVVFLNTK